MIRSLVALLLIATSAHATLTPPSSGGGGGGITSLNALTGATQTFTSGSSGTDFSISSTGTDHTFNLPTGSASNRGLISSADWTAFNAKQASGSYITALTGDVTAAGPGSSAATIANLAVTNAKIANGTVDLAAKVTGLLPIANQVSQPHTQVIQIDMNRVDSYTADGSITRPYKTAKAAVDASTCADLAKCLFVFAPGSYVEANTLKFGPWMYIDGGARDLVLISKLDATPIVFDFAGAAAGKAGTNHVTFPNGLTVDRTGAGPGGASFDMRETWGGALSYVGIGSGSDFLHMKNCYFTGAVTLSGLSGVINTTNFLSTLTMGTAGATSADGFGYYALITFQSSYIAAALSATAASAKPAGYQFFGTYGDGNWDFNGTAAIDLYTDISGTLGAFATYTKTNVTTYRYGELKNMAYAPAATNWAGSAPTNVHDALERMAAQVKALGLGAAIP